MIPYFNSSTSCMKFIVRVHAVLNIHSSDFSIFYLWLGSATTCTTEQIYNAKKESEIVLKEVDFPSSVGTKMNVGTSVMAYSKYN